MGGIIYFPGLDGKELTLNVPPGTQPNSSLIVKGAGVPGPTNGHMFVEIQVNIPTNLSNRARKLLEEFVEEIGESK